MDRFLYIGLTLTFTAYGQLVLKSRALSYSSGGDSDKLRFLVAMFTDVWVLSGLAAAIGASLFWMLAIQRSNLGFAYPFMALSFLIVPVAAALLLKESISTWQILGLTMIVAGVGINALAQ